MSEEVPVFLSRNRLEGSLADTPLKSLLEPCRRHLVTGTIRVDSREGRGVLQMRAGVVDHASFGLLVGDAAVIRMSLLRDGSYQLEQRAPDLSGELGPAAALESDVSHVPLSIVMRHCEDNALSCTVVVVSAYDRAEIRYRAGELVEVILNGVPDNESIVRVTKWTDARYKLQLDPLAPDIVGWPKVAREPTAPFKLERHSPPPAKMAHGSGPVNTVAPPPGSTPTPTPVAASPQGTPPPRTRAQTVRPQAVPPPPSAAVLGIGEATEVTGPPDILRNLPPARGAKKPPALIVPDEATPPPQRAASVRPVAYDDEDVEQKPLFSLAHLQADREGNSEVTAPRRSSPPPPPGKRTPQFVATPPMAAAPAPAPPREKARGTSPPPPPRRTPPLLAAVDEVLDPERPPSRPMPPPLPAAARTQAPQAQALRMNTSGSWAVPSIAVTDSAAAPLMAKPFVRETPRSSRGTWTFVLVLLLVFGGGGYALWYYAQPGRPGVMRTSPSEAAPAPAPGKGAAPALTPAARPASSPSAAADADVDPQPSASSAPAPGSVAALAVSAAGTQPVAATAARPAEKAPVPARQVGLRGKRGGRRR